MSEALLVAHSWLRWWVLVAGVVVVGLAVLQALGRGGDASQLEGRARLAFVIGLDLQLVLGLLLYFVASPVTAAALGDFGAAMRERTLRFWAVEHGTLMLLALVLAHVGNVLVRRAEGARRHRRALGFFGAALLAVLLGTPWPHLEVGRPLFRV